MMYMNLQIVLNTQNSPYLNRAAQKILAKIFLPKQILKSKISKLKNPFIIPVTWNPEYPPPPPSPPLFASLGLKRASQHLRICNCILNVLESDSR